ncbi:hypothetical protein GCM10010271_02830 [Streptomyces kurssanovii]|nr:hypothetical protein GCM10010271_02830 [Streptomyces kurssanovii]
MKIKRARIENFSCLRSLDVSFDCITSLIGPTGVGKSTVLRALDWFFNGERGGALGEEDVHSAADTKRIRVEVEFDGLTAADRDALGHYGAGRRGKPEYLAHLGERGRPHHGQGPGLHPLREDPGLRGKPGDDGRVQGLT